MRHQLISNGLHLNGTKEPYLLSRNLVGETKEKQPMLESEIEQYIRETNEREEVNRRYNESIHPHRSHDALVAGALNILVGYLRGRASGRNGLEHLATGFCRVDGVARKSS
jgi:hypothetical protein